MVCRRSNFATGLERAIERSRDAEHREGGYLTLRDDTLRLFAVSNDFDPIGRACAGLVCVRRPVRTQLGPRMQQRCSERSARALPRLGGPEPSSRVDARQGSHLRLGQFSLRSHAGQLPIPF
jgi:hypothetical protein